MNRSSRRASRFLTGSTVAEFRLAPLGPQHNESDYAAWTASVDHIRATPGFGGHSWPHETSLDDNLRDLEQHGRDFAERRGFTYTVLSAGADTGDVIGCVYIYPPSGPEPGGDWGDARGHQVLGACRPPPRSTRSSTTRSSHGWNATGPSTRSTTLHGPEPRASRPGRKPRSMIMSRQAAQEADAPNPLMKRSRLPNTRFCRLCWPRG